MTPTRAVKIILVLAAALWLPASSAQAADEPTRVRRVGVLALGDAETASGPRVMRRLPKRAAELIEFTIPQSVLLRADRMIE